MPGEPYEWKGYQQTVSIPIPQPDQAFAFPPDKRHKWRHIANNANGDHVFKCRACGKGWVVQSMVNLIDWKLRAAREQTVKEVLGPVLRRLDSRNPQPPRPGGSR